MTSINDDHQAGQNGDDCKPSSPTKTVPDQKKTHHRQNGKKVLETNFRSHYYEKVGFRGVNERKTLETILSQDPVNLEKLKSFVLQFSVPAFDRVNVWKYLSGVFRTSSSSRSRGWAWKVRVYNDLMPSIKYLKTAQDLDVETKTESHGHYWLVVHGRMRLGHYRTQLYGWDPMNFMAIFHTMSEICGEDVDAYYLSDGLWNKLNNPRANETILEMVALYHRGISDNPRTAKLFAHFEKIGLNEELPMTSWMARGFAGLFHYSALEKVWDKVLGGSLKILLFLALARTEVWQNALLACRTAKEAIRCFTSASEETDVLVAQKAIDQWIRDGRQHYPSSNHSCQHREKLFAQFHDPSSSFSAASAPVNDHTAAAQHPRANDGENWPLSVEMSPRIRIED